MDKIYKTITGILRRKAKKHNLLLKKTVLNSQAKTPKEQLHLYGKKEIKILKRPEQKTYIAGVMIHKDFVGLYSMAVYVSPNEFKLSPELKKALKGKSCFNIKVLDKRTEKEIEQIIEKNILIFKKKGWI